jgi:hypothetical protein
MGEIADALRANLRELAQADARLYRGLAEELGVASTVVEEPRALIQPEGGPTATAADLKGLKNDALQDLCAKRGIKVAKRARKDVMVDLLLADPNGPPPLSLLPLPKTKPTSGGNGTGTKGGKARPTELQALEAASRSAGAACAADRPAGGRFPRGDHPTGGPPPFRQPEADLCWRQPMAVNQETLEKLGRFLLRGLRIGASTVSTVELLRNDWIGGLSAGVAWLVFLQVARRLPPLSPEPEE